MKSLTKLSLLATLGFSLAGLSVGAADDTTAPKGPPSTGPATPPTSQGGKPDITPGPGKGQLRSIQNLERRRPDLPDEVKQLIEKFEKDRDAFLKDQDDLKKQLKDAAAEERAALREKLRDLKAKWLAEMREVREDIRDRIKELKDKLPHHQDIIDDAKENAGSHRGK